MVNFSDEFKQNINKLNADEAVLVLMEINHPLISDTIRLVRDNCNLVSNGETYIAMAFDVRRQNDIKDEVPKVSVVVQNVGRSLVKWIDQSGGGRDAEVRIMLARRSDPDNIEEDLYLSIERVSVNSENVNLQMTIQNNLIRKGTKLRFDNDISPGIF